MCVTKHGMLLGEAWQHFICTVYTVWIGQPVWRKMEAAAETLPFRVISIRMIVSPFHQMVGKESHSPTNVTYAVNSTSTKRIWGYIIVSTQVTLDLNVIYATRPSAKVDILQLTDEHTQVRNLISVMYVISTSLRKAICRDIIVYTQVINDMSVKYVGKLSFRMVNLLYIEWLIQKKGHSAALYAQEDLHKKIFWKNITVCMLATSVLRVKYAVKVILKGVV